MYLFAPGPQHSRPYQRYLILSIFGPTLHQQKLTFIASRSCWAKNSDESVIIATTASSKLPPSSDLRPSIRLCHKMRIRTLWILGNLWFISSLIKFVRRDVQQNRVIDYPTSMHRAYYHCEASDGENKSCICYNNWMVPLSYRRGLFVARAGYFSSTSTPVLMSHKKFSWCRETARFFILFRGILARIKCHKSIIVTINVI